MECQVSLLITRTSLSRFKKNHKQNSTKLRHFHHLLRLDYRIFQHGTHSMFGWYTFSGPFPSLSTYNWKIPVSPGGGHKAIFIIRTNTFNSMRIGRLDITQIVKLTLLLEFRYKVYSDQPNQLKFLPVHLKMVNFHKFRTTVVLKHHFVK